MRTPGLTIRIAASVLLLTVVLCGSASAANCGGAVPCQCGDRVVTDTVLTSDVGPCPWGLDTTELVGLRVDSQVVLDCDHHRIIGPGDSLKQEFGVKFGSQNRPIDGATLRNCDISGFWWGIHVTSSTNVVVEDNVIHDNGWKDPATNGTGYGIDIADIALAGTTNQVIVRRNQVHDNGDEGIHLSNSSGVELSDNALDDNGKQQIYLLLSQQSRVTGNHATGGFQGLEVRQSTGNAFSYNQWTQSPLNQLETNSVDNSFVYDDFQGELRLTGDSPDNDFSYVRVNGGDESCLDLHASGVAFHASFFGVCSGGIDAALPVTFDRCVGLPLGHARTWIDVHEGCNADIDGDGTVTTADGDVVAAALGSSPGMPSWNPAADLDRDGAVTASDQAIASWQAGPCPQQNRRPKPRLKASVGRSATGTPALVDLDATRSVDRDGRIVRFEIAVRNRLTGDLVQALDLIGVPADAARLEASFPPGLYTATLAVTDNYWARSKTIRRAFRVR
jgi:parallel beta-helix repeat protein